MNHDHASIRALLTNPQIAGHLLLNELGGRGLNPATLYIAGGGWVITIDAPGGEIWIADDAKIARPIEQHHSWSALYYPAGADREVWETIYDGRGDSSHEADTAACIDAVAKWLAGRP